MVEGREKGKKEGQHLPREAARDGYFTSAVHGVQGGLQDGHPWHDDGGEGAAPDQWRARHDHAALLHRAGEEKRRKIRAVLGSRTRITSTS